MHPSERPSQITAAPSTPKTRLPSISRITNSTTARAAAIIAALTTTACSSGVEVGGTVISNEGCSPVPTCPRPNLSGYGPNGEDYYLHSDRWYRVDPVSNEIFEVCDPTERDFCEEGETPEADGCDLPVCPGAQEAMCDPIPSKKDINSPSRFPSKAYFPTNNEYPGSVHWVNDDNINHPVIYDNAPDCEGSDTPNGDSSYTCDMIPTCEATIPYCDPMPRCQPGQSPISCEDGWQKFSFYDDCLDYVNNSGTVISSYNIAIIPGIDNICEEQYDPNINEYFYSPPLIYIDCLPRDECAEGEDPYTTTLSVDVDCGKWGSWTSVNNYAPSCDPIKSCK